MSATRERKRNSRRVEPDHEVVVIGAGFAGIGAAIRLRRSGFEDFVLLEQADDIGGTWRDNTYPGVGVDVASFSYQFSFEPSPEWSRVFAPGRELKAYADHCVDKYDVRRHLRLGTPVTELEFDEASHVWRVYTDGRGTVTARFVIPATGGFTLPKLPEIPGLEEFAGKTMHTAGWENDYDLRGKRVAVVGTGASAVQVVPSIAASVDRLDVYQRTPIWVLPKPDAPLHWPVRAMFRYVPATQYPIRLGSTALMETLIVLGFNYNRELPLVAKSLESVGRMHLRSQVRNRAVRGKLTPDYGLGCKRPSFSNDYLRTFNRANVELITDAIERVTPTGIQTVGGAEREVDTLVLATGFKLFQTGSLPAFRILGRDGVELGEFWEANRHQAYFGVSHPLFPNLFSILGPYSAIGASYFHMIENQMTHILRVITEAGNRGATLVAVRQDAHDRFFDEVLRRRRSQVFYNNHCGSSNSYYFDRHGDTPILRPGSGLEAWWRASHFSLDNYAFSGGAAPAERAAARKTAAARTRSAVGRL